MHTARLLTVSPSMHCAGPGPGGCLVLGGVVYQHALRQTPLWTEFLTHATENITLSQTSFAGGNDTYLNSVYLLKKSADRELFPIYLII